MRLKRSAHITLKLMWTYPRYLNSCYRIGPFIIEEDFFNKPHDLFFTILHWQTRGSARQDEKRGKKQVKLDKKISGTSFTRHFAARDWIEKFYLTIVQLCVNRLSRLSLPEIGRDLCGHGNRILARQDTSPFVTNIDNRQPIITNNNNDNALSAIVDLRILVMQKKILFLFAATKMRSI